MILLNLSLFAKYKNANFSVLKILTIMKIFLLLVNVHIISERVKM